MSSVTPENMLQALDAAHHLHPFTDNRLLVRQGVTVIERGEGVYVYDRSGREIIDAMAGLWNVAVGYGRQELIEAARAQLATLPYYNTFFGTTTPPAAELSGRLADLAPDGLDTVFFATSGSEAVDGAIRLARTYWQALGQTERKVIIGREFAYHGSTTAASSVGGMAPMHTQAGLLPDFAHIMPPYPFRYGRGEDPAAFGLRAAEALDAKIRDVGAHRVAAFFAEPVQGAGGVIVPPETYWPRVQEICRHHGVLLVADEVICGFGRTGAWWGCDTLGIEPDVMTVAKALTSGYLPLSATLINREITRVLLDGSKLNHGFTCSGHPVACAVALANLDVLDRGGVLESAASTLGPAFQAALRERFSDHPLVGEVRGVGLIAALELASDAGLAEGELGGRFFDAAFEQGVIVRPVRDSIALCPPLTMSLAEMEEMIQRLERTLELVGDGG